MNKRESILVVFGETLPSAWSKSKDKNHKYEAIVSSQKFQSEVETAGFEWLDIEKFVEPGSIYEASAFIEELSHLKLADGTRLPKSFTYKGYELWWMYHNNLFLYFCLPYTQYKKLLAHLKDFKNVYFYEPPYKSLFSCYLEAYGCEIRQFSKEGFRNPFTFLPFGIFVQILVTLFCLPILIIKNRELMVFIGDKFEKNQDYDFRMKFIYRELRQRNIPFVEFIRSLESWKALLKHVFVRKRPVVYSEGVAFVGKYLSVISGDRRRAKRKFGPQVFETEKDPQARFKLLVASHHFLDVYDDIWATKIMKLILRVIGVKASFIAAALDRNFHAVIGCKLNSIPTVGILHGVASRHYNLYDFLPGFDGEKSLSVDKYGVWSEWWKEYYVKNSNAYRPEQLFVSGPMRPLEKETEDENKSPKNPDTGVANKSRENRKIRVLFVSEQLAVPSEVVPYLEVLLNSPDVLVTFTFRNYRDGFKNWLDKYRPDFLKRDDIMIAQNGLQDAIKDNDVVVGSHSTAVLEALFQYKVPIFFETKKWGDYYSLKEHDEKHTFFAENPNELIEKVKNAPAVSNNDLGNILERYFGDPSKNGSKWVVDQLEGELLKGRDTK